MGLGRGKEQQCNLWLSYDNCLRGRGMPFYERLQQASAPGRV